MTSDRIPAWLEDLREDDHRRRAAFAVAVVVGLAASTVHWLGLVAGGALVGLTRQSLGRAVGAGFVFGVAVLLWAFLTVPTFSPGTLSVLSPVSYLAVAVTLLIPVWGALVRGVV